MERSLAKYFSLKWYQDNPWVILILICAILNLGFHPLAVRAASTTIDPTVFTTAVTHNGTTFTDVFTTDQTGYVFYRDADGSCSYQKTTNAGATWGGAQTIDPQTDCIRIAVWYDQWTPGNTTGTIIHVVTMDTSADDLWYTRFDTATDSTTTPVSIAASQVSTFAAGGNLHSVTVAGNGTIYSGVMDAQDSFVVRCSANCTTSSSWSEAGTSTVWNSANDWILLLPIGTSSNVMAVNWVINTDLMRSKTWINASSAWTTNWVSIDTCQNNTTYDGHFGATMNKIRGDIYVIAACDTQTIGGGNDDIRSYIYYNSSSSWASSTAAVITNDATRGITGAKVGLDSNTGNVYAIYSARTTGNIATSGQVYYKISTSTMSNWGSEQGPINSTQTDIYGLRIDGLNDERIYASWVDAITFSLHGATVADLTQTTYNQSAYGFFQNLDSGNTGPQYVLQDTPGVTGAATSTFRLRMLLHVGGSGVDAGGQDFKLQVASSTSGNCTSTLSNFADVSQSTGTIRFWNNPSVTNGVALTASSTDPTHNTDTVVNQSYVEQNNFSVTSRIQGGQDGKWDFALENFSGTSLQAYCFRIVKADGSLLNSYSKTPEVSINDPPTAGSVHLNGDLDIALTEGTTTSISATGTISDANGTSDLYGATIKIYRAGVGQTCTLDDNNCYQDNSCNFLSCAGNSCTVQCTVKMWFYADPTDPGTPFASDGWQAALTARDNEGATATATSSNVDVLSTVGFAVSSTIPYGSLSPGSTTNPLSFISRASSTGNVSMDMNVYAANMVSGANTIPPDAQHFATSSVGYSSSSAYAATSSPGTFIDINLKKDTSSTTLSTTTLWWGIKVPTPQPTGNYSGTNTFVGVVNSLPWP